MSVRVIRPRELSEPELAKWRQLQQQDPHLWSPFFSPEFTQAVGAARDDAFVAVIANNAGVVGFFPFQKRGRVAKPIGSPISDYQGLILETDTVLPAQALLQGCGVDAIDFNHVPAVQETFRQNSFISSDSPFLNIDKGYTAYIARRKQSGVQEIDSTLRKARKLGREIGAVRFEANDESDLAWAKLVEWKNAQYRSSNLVETLSRRWVVDTLMRIRSEKSTAFSGLLSSLYAGDRLLAVHFGMRSETEWHYWFPAYDVAFQKYSAGLILLLRMAEHGAATGIRRIDLGRGQSRYKNAFADGATDLCEGSIERTLSVAGALRRIRKKVESGRAPAPAGSARDLSRRVFNRLLWRV